MNRNKYLENLEIKNRRLLLKIYKKHIDNLKLQIYYATEKGNDTTYLQQLHNKVEQEIAVFQKELKQYSTQATKISYESGAKTSIVGEVAKEIAGTYVFGSTNREAMQVLAKTTYQPLSKMAQQIGRATLEYMKRENFQDTQTVLKALGKFVDSEFLRKTGVEGIGNVVVGSESWQTAARKIRDKILNDGGLKVPYYNSKGKVIRFVNAQDYARMVARTTTANVFREGAKDRILEDFEDDGDLVEIIGVSVFPNSPCIPYQGQILSLEGRTKGYTTIKEAKANGLFHPNCIHNFGVGDKVMQIYGYDVRKENTKKVPHFIDKVLKNKVDPPQNEVVVGKIESNVSEFLKEKGVSIKQNEINLTRRRIEHTLRDKKKAIQKVNVQDLKNIENILKKNNVYYDKQKKNIIYIGVLNNNEMHNTIKIPVNLWGTNEVATMSKVPLISIINDSRYEKID